MRSPLIWQSPWVVDSKILVEAEALESIDRYRQNGVNKPEAGGILLGYRRGTHLHITLVTEPQPSDRGARFWFNRSAGYHQQIALQQWRSSEKTIDYLGEWHTHPEVYPSPSSLDLLEWKKICAFRQNPLVFLILGWSGEFWVGLSNGNTIARCLLAE